ncbi:hypothetical protein Hdeb2414_s0356g00875241 [Helianthus debilis subsp. tardiflorus]
MRYLGNVTYKVLDKIANSRIRRTALRHRCPTLLTHLFRFSSNLFILHHPSYPIFYHLSANDGGLSFRIKQILYIITLYLHRQSQLHHHFKRIHLLLGVHRPCCHWYTEPNTLQQRVPSTMRHEPSNRTVSQQRDLWSPPDNFPDTICSLQKPLRQYHSRILVITRDFCCSVRWRST